MFYSDLLYDYSLCVGLGYLILYTFLAFMFWINSMAVNIFLRFFSVVKLLFIILFIRFRSVIPDPERQSGGVTRYLLYSQSAPFLVCILVYVLDKYGDCGWVLPKMGHAQCFLGDYTFKQSNRL